MENDIIKQKQERFKSMGIPIPMDKSAFEQPIVNVKDPKMLDRINQIKNGAKKGEFNTLLTAGEKNSFKPIPESKKRNQQPSIQEGKSQQTQGLSPVPRSQEADMLEKMFSGESDLDRSFKSPSNNNGQRIAESVNYDLNGTDFLKDFRSRMQSKVSSTPSIQSNRSFGFKESSPNDEKIDLSELENKIQSLSADVAKKVALDTIKTVLGEYLSKKTDLNENSENTFKKVKDDIVKIEGKYYKLVPVKLKSKQ
jgi:hypothetical protein